MSEKEKVPIERKLLLTKEEASEYSHIGINTLEHLLKDPKCPFVLYIGTKKLIKREPFEAYLLKIREI